MFASLISELETIVFYDTDLTIIVQVEIYCSVWDISDNSNLMEGMDVFEWASGCMFEKIEIIYINIITYRLGEEESDIWLLQHNMCVE